MKRIWTSTALFLTAAVVVVSLWALLGRDGDRMALLLDPSDETLVQQGLELYGVHCASCHGAELEGEPNWRQRKADGLLPAPPHDESGHTWHHPSALLIELTKYGPQLMAGPDYKSAMQPYQGILEDAEIRAILSYIKSTWPAEIRARHDAIDQAAKKQS